MHTISLVRELKLLHNLIPADRIFSPTEGEERYRKSHSPLFLHDFRQTAGDDGFRQRVC